MLTEYVADFDRKGLQHLPGANLDVRILLGSRINHLRLQDKNIN